MDREYREENEKRNDEEIVKSEIDNEKKSVPVSADDLLGKLKEGIKNSGSGRKNIENSDSDSIDSEDIDGDTENFGTDGDDDLVSGHELNGIELNSDVALQDDTGEKKRMSADDSEGKKPEPENLEEIMRRYMSEEEAEKYAKPKSFDWETDEKSESSALKNSDDSVGDDFSDFRIAGSDTDFTHFDADDNTTIASIEENVNHDSDSLSFDGDSEGNGDFSPEDSFDSDDGTVIDDTDVRLMVAFGMEDELERTLGFDKAAEMGLVGENVVEDVEGDAEKKDDYVEFTSPSQIKEIMAGYRKKYRVMLVKILACVCLMLFALGVENITLVGGSLPSAMNPATYPVVNVMVGFQLLVLSAALIPDILIRGAKALQKFKPVPESAVTVLMASGLLYHILVLIFSNHATQASIKLYNFPIIVCVLASIVHEFLNLRREIFSFNICSSKRVKYVVEGLTEEQASLENEAFSDFLPDDASIFHIGRANFVDGFFARMKTSVKQKDVLKVIIPTAVIVSVLFFVLDLVVDRSIQQALSVWQYTLAMGIPFTVLLVYSYPFFVASKEAYKNGSAIIGESSLEEYSTASAITFEDKDVFPSYGVVVKSIKTYGSGRIDDIIYNAASLFIKAGGPLSEVFEVATRDLEHSKNVEIFDAVSGGLEATVSEAHIYCGNADYMMEKGFNVPYDVEDDAVIADGSVSIMYMAKDGEICAKMYIQYVIDPDFETTLRQLCKMGMCVGIKTFDPNIDEQMLQEKLRTSNYRVKVLRCRTVDDLVVTKERLESGVVSKKSAKAMMQTYSLCDKVLHAMKTGVMIKTIAMVFSFVIVAFAIVAKAGGVIYSLYVALYQIVWMIPTVIISKLCVGRTS